MDWSFAGRIEFWIEASWIGALIFVPLVFSFRSWLPTFDELKTYNLHFFGLLTLSLMSWDLAFKYMASRKSDVNKESVDVLEWVRRDKSHWLIASIAVFVFIYIASTALSPMPFFSFWGISPASSGYNLYSFLSIIVIITSMLVYVRSAAQVKRILYVIAGVGTLASIYGTFQHFGWDPIGNGGEVVRIYSTFGNPIMFGAFLAMSIPVTVALAQQRHFVEKRWPVAIFALAIGVQLGALWFTGSRGPIAGLAAALAITAVVALTLMPRKFLVTYAATVAGAIVFGLLLVVAPGGNDSTRAVQFGGQLDNLTNEATAGHVEAGLEGRREIWREVIELSTSWERQYPDTGISKALRPVFGYGPDMLRFSAPLASNPRTSFEVVDHAHNRPLMVLAEQGWAGLLSFLAVTVIAAYLAFLIWIKLRSKDGGADTLSVIIFMGLIGALVGIGVEQSVGVGRVGDLLVSWTLIALLAIFYKSVAGKATEPQTDVVKTTSAKPKRGKSSAKRNDSGAIGIAGMFIAATAVSVASLATFLVMDVQMFRASRIFMEAFTLTDGNDAYAKFQQSQDLAPHVELFVVNSATLLLDDSRELLDLERHNEAADLAEEAYKQLSEYVQRNPLGFYARLTLAASAAQMVDIGVVGWDEEMTVIYRDVAEQFPNEGGVLAVTANAFVAAGRLEEGIEYAERSIAISEVSAPLSQPYWILGEALIRQSDTDGAIAALTTATEKQPDSEYAAYAHRNLATIYEALGDDELAQDHRKTADEILYNGQAPGS